PMSQTTEGREASPPGLESDDRALQAIERLNPHRIESAVAHPAHALARGVFESAGSLDEHIETRKQGFCLVAARVIDEGVVDDQGTCWRQRAVRLLQQHKLGWQIPIVQDAPHDEHVGARQFILEKISGMKSQLLLHPVSAHEAREHRLDLGEIEATATQMGM